MWALISYIERGGVYSVNGNVIIVKVRNDRNGDRRRVRIICNVFRPVFDSTEEIEIWGDEERGEFYYPITEHNIDLFKLMNSDNTIIEIEGYSE